MIGLNVACQPIATMNNTMLSHFSSQKNHGCTCMQVDLSAWSAIRAYNVMSIAIIIEQGCDASKHTTCSYVRSCLYLAVTQLSVVEWNGGRNQW